jgi:hypothetical protein
MKVVEPALALRGSIEKPDFGIVERSDDKSAIQKAIELLARWEQRVIRAQNQRLNSHRAG